MATLSVRNCSPSIQAGKDYVQQGKYGAAIAVFSGVISQYANVSLHPHLTASDFCEIAKALAERAEAYRLWAQKASTQAQRDGYNWKAVSDYGIAWTLACAHNCPQASTLSASIQQIPLNQDFVASLCEADDLDLQGE